MAGFLSMLKQSTLVHLCFAISFFTSGLIINSVQCVLYLGLKPFNKHLYRTIGYYLCYSFYSQLVFLADWWSDTKLNVYISDEDMKYCGTEHVLLLMNHTYEIDWLLGWMFCEKVRVLGNCKAYAKKVIQYIPTIGWAWKFAEFVFLERSFEKDREIIGRQINEILDYPDPVWLLLNAEGTRFTEQKHEASVKFAQEKGMVPLKHHLIPRTKGFTASLPFLREKCPSVLDIQLAISKDSKVKPTIFNILNGKPIEAHMCVRRFPTATLPTREEDAAVWLQDLFREKDRMQDSFHRTGSFFTDSGIAERPRLQLHRRPTTLVNTAFWVVATLTPMLYYLMKLLFSGEILYFSIGAGIIFAFYMLMVKAIGMSKISKASSYGAEKLKNGHSPTHETSAPPAATEADKDK
ncbi:1-acyl-sn-glycerol-3-phosphate acyltransferase gamma-like [Anopheles stephensi]|uniref:Phospholipid/glycerol acyltransferase domain-containing protein n=1 Tax=Anopheles stephensi TaxID=30069 RepID=A0A182YEK2_ANOST|nr:1-acyl-sn-glycerol-3-phosphate acyltransferase gamma-like [Anopheles stephensi]XP_035910319.1 1-acyl-sn-glycerol-3-phosphate acyltransferase gamma-like [Anopheles stephensi]XP_035910321.1 1-acyl-sn-glycerol-3-phosphate acyltransferase gamma-like [Anopheles stephensi]XP_035910322.1 1-acyl-sn-glycerol-3-phosphate acyltransferase gamma-like [Anopheles stephensi]